MSRTTLIEKLLLYSTYDPHKSIDSFIRPNTVGNYRSQTEYAKQYTQNEQRILTHAYIAMMLVAVSIVVCLLNALKPNEQLKNEQPNEHQAN